MRTLGRCLLVLACFVMLTALTGCLATENPDFRNSGQPAEETPTQQPPSDAGQP